MKASRLTSLTAAALIAVACTAMSQPAAVAEVTACPTATITASTVSELSTALAAAQPGDVIEITDGTYDGNWTATTAGTSASPIWLCGGPAATLTNGGIHGSYGLWLDGASYWHLHGFSVTSAQKGVVVDAADHVTVEALTVHDVGDEGIHLRTFTTDSTVTGNTIHNTGQRRDKFGEGVYVGSANGNWSVYTGGQPDRSDRNTVSGNTIFGTTAESVDIKEGTSGGLVVGNTFDGSAQTVDGGDSWVDAKGNDWTISGNVGHHSTRDGYQVHHNKLLKLGLGDWGLRNTFTGNTADVQGPGYGLWVHDASTTYNVVRCDNTVTAAALGYANVPCVP